MADGPGRGVAAAVGWAGLSLKYVDRTSSPRLGVSSRLPLLSRKTFGAPSLLRLPSRRTLGGRARHGATLYRGRGARNCLWMSAPFSSAFLHLRFFLSQPNFQFAPEIPDFRAGARLTERERRHREVLSFDDDALDRSLNDWSF